MAFAFVNPGVASAERYDTWRSIEPGVKIVLLEEAQRQFEGEDAWWRGNLDAKELFVEEFAQTLEQVSSMPETVQTYRRARGRVIQRLLMKKTRCQYPK